MFSTFGSLESVEAAMAPWISSISPWVLPAFGIAIALALMGLVLRGKSGVGGASSDPVPREVVTGSPVDRPKRPA